MKLPEEIESERIVLKHPVKPTFKLAEELYAIVDESRNTLREWQPWVDKTNSVEDEFSGYLVTWYQKHWDEVHQRFRDINIWSKLKSEWEKKQKC